jgi:hypothetical protein
MKAVCEDLIELFEIDETFGDCLIFSDEAAFHLSGKMNKKNVHIWQTEQLHVTVHIILNLLKGSMLCAVSNTKMHAPSSLLKLVQHTCTCWNNGCGPS